MIRRAWHTLTRSWREAAAIIAEEQAAAQAPAPAPGPGRAPAPSPAPDPVLAYGRFLKSIDVFENATVVTDWATETSEVFPAAYNEQAQP